MYGCVVFRNLNIEFDKISFKFGSCVKRVDSVFLKGGLFVRNFFL